MPRVPVPVLVLNVPAAKVTEPAPICSCPPPVLADVLEMTNEPDPNLKNVDVVSMFEKLPATTMVPMLLNVS